MQSKNVNELIEKVFERKKIFNQEYDDSANFKDLRWQEVLEGFLFEQLHDLSKKTTNEELLGKYVNEFFKLYEEGKLSV